MPSLGRDSVSDDFCVHLRVTKFFMGRSLSELLANTGRREFFVVQEKPSPLRTHYDKQYGREWPIRKVQKCEKRITSEEKRLAKRFD